jgi:hypothetical protein
MNKLDLLVQLTHYKHSFSLAELRQKSVKELTKLLDESELK